MSSNYVDGRYVENGYFEGSINLMSGSKRMKFFVSLKTDDIDLDKQAVIDGISENEIGVLYAPLIETMFMTDGEIFFKFGGDVNAEDVVNIVKNSDTVVNLISNTVIESIAANETFVNSVAAALAVTASVKASDGTTVGTLEIVKDNTSFSFVVPQELSGTEYSVVVDVSSAQTNGE